MQPHILHIDAFNMLHRMESGFQAGEYPIVFQFFRSLRALVEKMSPTRAYFVTEGHPRARHLLLDSYKQNRVIDPADEKKLAKRANFNRQSTLIIELLKKHFPVQVVRHPDYEADDVIYNLIMRSAKLCRHTVVSSDTDFIQLLSEPNVTLYNPIADQNVTAPAHDYVSWKALRGDASDNVPRVEGIKGDKHAEKLLASSEELSKFLAQNDRVAEYNRNVALIRLTDIPKEERDASECSQPIRDWDAVREQFIAWDFKSFLKDKTWDKFTSTFDALWGT